MVYERKRDLLKTTQGILESVVNPNTMEVIHYWPGTKGYGAS
jgi:hypothetical protein